VRILALETSCDDTAAAIVDEGCWVRATVVVSQTQTHAQYGGVIPELAAREHGMAVNQAIAAALTQAECPLESIDIVAATVGPGLVGALLVGATAAKTLATILGKPFRGVHHLQGHIAACYLKSAPESPDWQPPFICLLASGGHTQLIHVRRLTDWVVLGETLDDAVGEAYDKVGRLLKLPYPGGPHVDALAIKAAQEGLSALLENGRFPIARTENPLCMSFSGLKTAVLRYVERHAPSPEDTMAWAAFQQMVAGHFQATIMQTLLGKIQRACEQTDCWRVALAGGVAANAGLRQTLQVWQQESPQRTVFLPEKRFCTDNAAMIAAAAFVSPWTHDRGEEVFSRAPITDRLTPT